MAEHPLVTQLRFARSEFVRGFDGVTAADAVRRVMPMNPLGWMVGHLANQEHRFWVETAQGLVVAPDLRARVGSGQPSSSPPLEEMWAVWRTVTGAADVYLDSLTTPMMQTSLERDGLPLAEVIGTLLSRTIYHYWFHTGEVAALRQLLGHVDLPQFVGDMTQAAYRPEPGDGAGSDPRVV